MRARFYTLFLTAFFFVFLALNVSAQNYTMTTSNGNSIIPGTVLIPGSQGDDQMASVTLPFTYQVYGTNYTTAQVSTNGNLQFTTANSTFTNVCPLPAAAMGVAFHPFWDDLHTGRNASEGIFTSVSGSAPNRIFNIEWRAEFFGSGTALNFEVRLFEGQQRVDFIYGNMTGTSASASIGVQRVTPANQTTYSCNAGGAITAGFGITFQIAVVTPVCTLTCPPNMTVSAAAGQCNQVVTFPGAGTSGICGTVTATPASGSTFPVGVTQVTMRSNVLTGQLGTPIVPAGVTSQNFEPAFDAFDNQAAEDFVVPLGQNWSVTGLFVMGEYSIGGGPVNSINVTFYSDAGGSPGAVVQSFSNLTTFTGGPNFDITLPSAVSLPGGSGTTYWLSVQVNMDLGTQGQWFWDGNGGTVQGNDWRWQNPGGGFGTPCATWGNHNTCLPTNPNTNLIFSIFGTGLNNATCSFTVTVVDNQPPTITCPANITVSNTAGQCSAVVATPAPTNADNCGVTTRTWALSGATTGTSAATGINTVPANQVFNVGVTTVTYTARDNAGNSATCSFTVTVNDTQPPIITCPANITQNNDPGLCSAAVNYPLPTATDNCASIILTRSTNNQVLTALSGVACSAAPNQFWRWYTMPGSGSTTINSVRFGVEQSNAAQTVTVRLYTSAGPFPASPRTQIASATVAVTTAPLVFYTVNFASPPSVPAGTIVAVEVDAQTAVMYPGANGLGQSAPSYISASACGATTPTDFAALGFPNTHLVIDLGVSQPVPVTLVSGPAPGGTFPVGTTTVTYRATDPAGNQATCSFTVTVVDAEQPTITCPANITRPTDIGTCVAAGVVVPNPTNADNCGIVTRTWVMTGATTGSSPATGINSVGTQTFNIGVTTITYTVRDAAGNSRTCSFTVTITDAEIPVISAQPQNTTACANDNVTLRVTAAPAGGTFTLTYQWQRFDGTAWVNIAGATTNSYSLSNVDIPLNHTSFRVLIQGRCTQVTSNVATLNVNPKPKVFVTSSTTSFVIRPGENISLIASAIPTGGTVQWSFNGNPIANGTLMTLPNVSVNNLGVGTYTATYTDLNGCVQSASVNVTGEALTRVFVYPSPTTGQFQVRFFNTAGQQVTVNVYDSKGGRVYTKNETLGAQQYSQIKVNLGNAQAGTYLVEVTDASGNKIGTGHVVVGR